MDMLSLSIGVKGKMFFEEAMAGEIYTKFIMGKPHRGFLYNLSSHNTVLAYSKPIFEDAFFSHEWGIYKPDTILDAFEADGEDYYVKAHHNGYGCCSVQRELKFLAQTGFLIRDSVFLGTRTDTPHIQRWFLSQGVTYQTLSDRMILFQNGDAKLLCVWNSEEVEFRFWKPDFLIPDIYQDASEYNFILDVAFTDKRQRKQKVSSTSILDTVMLDVSNRSHPSELHLDAILLKLYQRGVNDPEVINTLKNSTIGF